MYTLSLKALSWGTWWLGWFRPRLRRWRLSLRTGLIKPQIPTSFIDCLQLLTSFLLWPGIMGVAVWMPYESQISVCLFYFLWWLSRIQFKKAVAPIYITHIATPSWWWKHSDVNNNSNLMLFKAKQDGRTHKLKKVYIRIVFFKISLTPESFGCLYPNGTKTSCNSSST